jgi:hypothetical protein
VATSEADWAEEASSVYPDLCCRKQWGVVAPEFFSSQEVHPVSHDCADVIPDWEKEAWKGLGPFCCDLPAVLIDLAGRCRGNRPPDNALPCSLARFLIAVPRAA